MRISDWSSDVCSSDLSLSIALHRAIEIIEFGVLAIARGIDARRFAIGGAADDLRFLLSFGADRDRLLLPRGAHRSEEHTSELQSLMRISYAVFCLKKKNKKNEQT